LHWAEITKRHRTSSPLASLCFNYTVGFHRDFESWGVGADKIEGEKEEENRF